MPRCSRTAASSTPDYVINAGGVIHLAGYETLGWDEARMGARLAGIGETLAGIFGTADAERITTVEAADQLALERLAADPPGSTIQGVAG